MDNIIIPIHCIICNNKFETTYASWKENDHKCFYCFPPSQEKPSLVPPSESQSPDEMREIQFVGETPDPQEYNFLGSVHRGTFNLVKVNPALDDLFQFLLLDKTEIHTNTGVKFLTEEKGWFTIYVGRKERKLVAVRGVLVDKYNDLLDDMEGKAAR